MCGFHIGLVQAVLAASLAERIGEACAVLGETPADFIVRGRR